MWGISSQPAETSTSVDKLSAENDEGYDPLYHSGRSIESATEMEGLNQLFSPGESPMTASSSVYGMPGSIGRQHPADGDTPSLVTYPLAAPGSTDGGGGESLMQQQQYDRIPGSVVHSAAAAAAAAAAAITSSAQGLLQRSSSADQMTALRSYHCRLCKQEFENKSDMQNHSKELHRKEEKSHKCLHCLKSFPTSQQLGQHSLVHSNLRKYPCAYCDKSFKQLSHVQQHQRIHTGERPYKCIVDGCSKAFRQLSSLQQHLKGHSLPLTKSFSHLQSASSSRGELAPGSKFKKETLPRPHDLTCQVCEKRCADDELFFQHIHKHHPDFWRVLSGGLPLSDFVSPSSSSSEMRSTKAKKFTCPVCDKRYAHETGYAKHLASHPSSSSTPSRDPGGGGSSSSGAGQLYSCAVCRKMFTREVHLYRHLEMKTDPGHSASFAELKKKKGSSSSSSFVNSAYDLHPSCPSSSVDPDSSSKSLRTSSFLDYPTTMMRSSSYDHQCPGDAATEFLLQTAASRSRYRYGRDSSDAADVAFSSAAAMHLGGVSSSSTCLSPHSGSSTPDAFPYVRPFAGTGAFGGDVCGHRGDYDPGAAAAFRGYSFQFGGHMNQDFSHHHHHHHHHHGRSPSYAAAQNFRGASAATQPDPRHSYFPSAYAAASSSSSQGGGSGCQGPLHGVISQPPFVHPSVETARFDSAGGGGGGGGGGLLDPYLQRNGFSDHEVATALHQLARSIPGFI